jgi:hypothetical protein
LGQEEDVQCSMFDVQCGMWNVGCCDVRCRVVRLA